jgi:gliding motility-associated-like protein
MLRQITSLLIYSSINFLNGQTLIINEVPIVNKNEIIYCQGDVLLNSSLDNKGVFVVNKSGGSVNDGNLILTTNGLIKGNGTFKIHSNLEIGDGAFSCDTCNLILNGNRNQFTNANSVQNVLLKSLVCEGDSTIKSISNINFSVFDNIVLATNELELRFNELRLFNTNPNSLDQSLNTKGFISTDESGCFYWKTSSSQTYLVPLGSRFNFNRRRPLILESKNDNIYGFQFFNFSADNTSYVFQNKDDRILKLNDAFFHTLKSEQDDINPNKLSVAYNTTEDGIYNGLAEWKTAKWRPIQPSNHMFNGSQSFVKNEGMKFSPLGTPIILTSNFGSEFYIPNTFIPDENDINDVFEVVFSPGYTIREAYLKIYNRWGQQVHFTNQIPLQWDGTYQGKKVQEGIYTWEFYLERSDRTKEKLYGHVNLLK